MVDQQFFRSAIGERKPNRIAHVGLGAMHLPLGQLDELVENSGLLPVVAMMAAAVVFVPIAAATVGLSPFEHRQLVTEVAHAVRVTMVVGLANRFTDLTLEPRVESTVDLPLCVAVTTGGRLFPTLCNPNDLLEVLSLVEVRATHVVRRPGRPVNRPSRIVNRAMWLHAHPNRPDPPRTTLRGDHDGRMPIPTPPILRIRLSHSGQRQNKNPKVK